MRFAINYSPRAAALVDEGVIDVDLFKCPTASDPVVREHRPRLIDEARRARPVYIHFPLQALDLSGVDWAEIDEALTATETRYVNVHLSATVDDFPDIDPDSAVFSLPRFGRGGEERAGVGSDSSVACFGSEKHVDSVDEGRLSRVAERFIEGVGHVVDRYGAERVIVENVVYTGPAGKFLRAGIEPAVINRVVGEAGCGLLLDLAHARITCSAAETDPREYLSSLPIHALRELHVTGTGDGDRLRDSMPMNDEDWALLDWTVHGIRNGEWPTPWAVAFEYGGIGPLFDWRSDANVIAEQVPRLQSILRRAQPCP